MSSSAPDLDHCGLLPIQLLLAAFTPLQQPHLLVASVQSLLLIKER